MASTLRPEYFVNALRLGQKPVAQLVDQEKAHIESFRKTPGSRRNAFTDYRNAIRDSDLPGKVKAEAICGLTITDAEQTELTDTQWKKVSERQSTNRAIYDIDAYLNKALVLLNNRSYIDRALGLMMVTGRRIGEILSTGGFVVDSECPDTHVIFSGQLKLKGRPDPGPYPIPVLIDPARVVAELNRIRDEKPGLIDNLKKMHNATSKDASVRVKKHSAGIVERADTMKTHDLRRAYAEIAYYLSDNKAVAKPKYFSLILGHGENDVTSAQTYHGFYIAE